MAAINTIDQVMPDRKIHAAHVRHTSTLLK